MALELLDQILPLVRSHIYPSLFAVKDWKIKVGDISGAHLPSFNDNSWTLIQPPQAQWGAYDTTFWFRTQIAIPPGFAGKPVVLLLDMPEALVYLNGSPFQGVDINHPDVLISDKARAHQKYSVAIQAYSGRKKEPNMFTRADLAVLNPTARSLYNGLMLLKDLEKIYGTGTQESKDVRELIRRTLIFLKYYNPDGEEYPNAIARAYRFLSQTVLSEFRSSVPGTIHWIGHAHLDVVWLWTLREARRKAGRTFSTALRLMEEFPEFKFTATQPQLYEFVKNDYPELFKQIKQRVTEGRWEVVGPMWVEPDCNLPNGESLVRHILQGKRFYRGEFGIDSNIAWLPDSFGYSAALPQILKKTGINYFFTTKLAWNDTTRFPHNSFWWKGIDGSKILAHQPAVGLEGQMSAKDLRKSWNDFNQKDTLADSIQTYGYGDGGGGPTKEQIDTAGLFGEIPTLPKSRISTAREFFANLEEHGKELPTWEGELYLERHRGTFTTHGWIKRANRSSERSLYTAELLATLALLNGGKRYRHDDLTAAWRKLLLNQFHDILPGTSIADSHEDVRRDFSQLRRTTDEIIRHSLSMFSKPAKKRSREFHTTVFNPLPWERNEYVEIQVKSKEKKFIVTDDRGQTIEHQILDRADGKVRILCYLPQIPGCSSLSFRVAPSPQKEMPQGEWKLNARFIETPIYRLRINKQGQFTSLHDKRLRREILRKGDRGNQFQTFNDRPEEWEAWDIDGGTENKKADVLEFRSLRIVEQGPLRLKLETHWRTARGSTVTQHIFFYHKLPRIDFKTRILWNEKTVLLKAAFPLNLNTSFATYEIQFGALKRSAKPKTPEEKAKFEVPAQQWADMSDAKFGVSLLNDSKYGYDARENVLRLTLLRSPRYPHPIDPARQTESAATDQGEHEFVYSLLPHAGDWMHGETVRRARELNHPVLIVEDTAAKRPSPLFLSLRSNIDVDCVKKSEEGNDVIIRLHEAHGQSTKTTLEFGYGVEQAFECDLLENPLQKLKPSRTKLAVKFSPFEIKTLRLKFRPRKLR